MLLITLAGLCVFAAVYLLSSPPVAALRLAAALPMPASDTEAAGWRARGSLRRRGRDVAARRAAVVDLCDGMVIELVAGLPPGTALLRAAETLPDLPGFASVVEVARNGGDVADVLDRAAEVPGCEGLRLLAGCWRIGAERGGALVSVIEGLGEALRDEQAHRDEVALQLAGPRASARLLAGLPLLGLAMAAAIGVRPLSFLLGTFPGAACLAVGIGLDALGLWWTRRLSSSAEEFR